ncbi:MAG: protein kinase [Acidobacteriota bacterium]|nr:protein kinase [Acidobacteriota bacterium]
MSEGIPEVLGHYRIVSLIGSGGMGEVYLADDETLGRRVAIKILPVSVSRDPDARRRMLREARAVAALDHPNVCTIYDVGEVESRPYIVMQYIEGGTLFDRLRDSRLTLAECFDIGMQVSAALDEAHSHGVIHRDIKPMNIMLTGRGQVKVLDFGLARFAETKDGSTEVLSRTGIVTGTAPYMSPEQLRGTATDARSDIFSFGIVLYEMATGRRPFDRDSTVATITAILFEDPEAIVDEEVAPLVPIIKKALAKEPSKRYASSAQMMEALEQAKSRPRSRARRPRTEEMEAARMTKPPALASQKTGSQKSSSQKTRTDSLAVLPFMSAKPDAELEYLIYGLSEGIVNALSPLRKLRVIAQATTARYAGTEIDAREVGRELNVAAIVGVRAHVEADQLHADVNLVSTADAEELWSSKYMRAIRDVAAMAETIAGDVAERVGVRTGSGPRRVVKKKRAVDPEAQQLFLKGRFQWIKRHPEAVKLAMGYFQQAVELDPSFAMPYAGLADSYLMLGFMQAFPATEMVPKVKAAAHRAIELDPLLADPHATLGYAAGLFEWDFDAGQRELEEAMRLNPNYQWAPHWLGILMCGRGQTRRALELIEFSAVLDPLSPIINVGAGIPLYVARRYEDAATRYRAVLDTETKFVPGHYYLGMALEMLGDYDGAIAHFKQSVEIAGPITLYLGALAHAYARSGHLADAERVIEQLHALGKQRYTSPYNLAVAYMGQDRNDEALTALEAALHEHNAWIWFVPIDPRFDRLREDPRFATLLARFGLPAKVEADG